jgi:hypothetical protein
MYDPGTGRFLNRDPIGYAGGINLHAYTENSPVSVADPEGISPHIDDQRANNLARRIDMLRRKIAEREGELKENPGKLPERAPGDEESPRLSRWGHRKLINMDKAQKGRLEKELGEMLGGPIGTEKKECRGGPHELQPWWVRPWESFVRGSRDFFGLDKPSPYRDFPGGYGRPYGPYAVPLPGFGASPAPAPIVAPIEAPVVPGFPFAPVFGL